MEGGFIVGSLIKDQPLEWIIQTSRLLSEPRSLQIGTIPAGVLDDADDRGGISDSSKTCRQARRPHEPHPCQGNMLRFSLTIVIYKFNGRPRFSLYPISLAIIPMYERSSQSLF